MAGRPVRAVVLHEYGVPRFDGVEEADIRWEIGANQAIVQALAAGQDQVVDVAICAPRFYARMPSVAGRDGVGRLAGDGRGRVYFDAPIMPFGSIAQRALIDRRSTYPVPDGLDHGMAVALGIAGLAALLALTWRAQLGRHVLVLGASGVLGQIAVPGAKLRGAARVVAAARSREGLERGADAAERHDGPGDRPASLSEAAEKWIDVVLDPLFGQPFVAALNAASVGRASCRLGPARAPGPRSPQLRFAATSS